MESLVERQGSKVVQVTSTGHEKQRMTACLAVRADGSKMKPFKQVQWVVEAWKQIKKQIVKKSFDMC